MVEKQIVPTLFVAVDGNDAWSGRQPTPDGADGPFATLERARDEIRKIKSAHGLPQGGIAVELAGGTYEMPRALTLETQDSGTENAPVVYRARRGEEVRISGGKILTHFTRPSDASILERLSPAARDHILQADLKALDIDQYGSPGGGGIELFFADRPMLLARWPNEGFARIADLVGGDPVDVRGTKGDRRGKFYYEGNRPQRWVEERDPWVHGYWFWDWSDQRHKIANIDTDQRILAVEPPYHGYGYRRGQWFYAMNILAELDTPGEWYVDRERGILYFWPPDAVEEGRATVSVLDTLLEINSAEYLRW